MRAGGDARHVIRMPNLRTLRIAGRMPRGADAGFLIGCRLALLLAVLAVAGCVAGKAVMIQPQEGSVRYQCGPYTIEPDGFFADGVMVLYYVVPLIYVQNSSETKSFLELPITISSDTEPVFDLTLQDVQVRIPGHAEAVPPSNVNITMENVRTDKPLFSKTFTFTFEIDRHRLREFTLVFPRPVHACILPDTPYLRTEERHYITPANS